MSDTTFMGVPRERIDWSPRIDYTKCDDCMECVDFCPHNVFLVQEAGPQKLLVKNPHNCVVFCRACAKTCGVDALTFPEKNDTVKAIRQIRKEVTENE